MVPETGGGIIFALFSLEKRCRGQKILPLNLPVQGFRPSDLMTEKELKSHFLLEPGVIFLNHGSFGAAPRPVFEAYQRWQLRLERQPVKFLARELLDELHRSRRALGQHLGAGEDNLVFIPNATYGVNLVARSLELKPEDEILTTDHEYGACDNIWDFIAEKTGARIVRQPIPLPLSSSSGILEQLWKGVTPRTRLIFLSHITSPTALRMPVEAICSRAKKAGILTLIDGAHAPGQIPLNLSRLGPIFTPATATNGSWPPRVPLSFMSRQNVSS